MTSRDMDREPEVRPAVVVNSSEAPGLQEAMTAIWSDALADDFARMPYVTRNAWRDEAARWFGLPSYAELRAELYGDAEART